MRKKILIVDDNKIVADVISEILVDAGYSVSCSETGEKALEMVKHKKYSLILIDVILPGLNGITLSKIIFEINPDQKIILMSGSGGVNLNSSLKQLSVFGFLEKPVRIGNLLSMVQSAIYNDKNYQLGDTKQLPRVSFSRERILLADDNVIIQKLISEVLTLDGYRVTVADNGTEAYEKIVVNKYDLIILDINMPKMTGVEAVKAIRERDPYTYILLISGRTSVDEVNDAIINGANEFLAKPFKIEELLKVVKNIDFIMIDRMKKRSSEKIEKDNKSFQNSIVDRGIGWVKEKFV